MSDFPNTASLPVTVWTGGKYGVGVGSRAPLAGTGQFATVAWGTANLAIYSPIWLPFRYPVKNLFIYNFATVNGNTDVGIYNKEFVLLTSVGSGTAQAGASTIQFYAKDIILDPGQYYIGVSSNSTTATFAAMLSGTATRHRYLGMLQQATAFPLPNPATPALVGQARIPAVGFTYLTGTPSF